MQSMHQIAFPPPLLASFLPWLMPNRDGLSILLHPGTGDAYADHRPRRLVGQRAAAADERSAKVAEDAVTFLKDLRCPPK
jgi:aromatic ring-cleaving dioxygenase